MSSTSETGHAKNVANFHKLITFIRGYGAAYNPAEYNLKLTQLEALLADAQLKLADVISKNATYNNTVNERKIAFNDLKPFSTRLLNVLQSTRASKELIDDAKGFNRKMRGQRSTITSNVSFDVTMPIPNRNSTSQQSYIQLVQHFAGLIAVLNTEPTYRPNEIELQIATLQAKQQDLTSKNEEVDMAYMHISNARNTRNSLFYTNPDSLFQIAIDAKKYIKGVFGIKSTEYIQIKKILFTKPNL